MSLDDALFLVRRGDKNYHSKGSDIGERMVAGDSVLVQRGTERFNATYDGTSWDKISDSDLLLAWDGTKNRKVTGKTFKELFATPEIPFAIYRKFCGQGGIKTSCGNYQYYGKGRANPGSFYQDHRLYEIDSNGDNIREKIRDDNIKFPVYVSNSVYPTYKLEKYMGYSSSNCTINMEGSSENNWRVPWRSGDTITDGYIIKLHESADVPFLEWHWRPDENVTSGTATLPPVVTTPYVYFGYDDLLEYNEYNRGTANRVFKNVDNKRSNIWLKIDNGPAVLIKYSSHHISTINSQNHLIEDNYIYANSLLKFFFYLRPPGNTIKFYQHDPDLDKKEFKGIYYVKTEGMSYGSNTIRRLDYDGNLQTSSSGTAFGIFIPLDVLHDRDPNGSGLHQFHPYSNFKDLDGAIGLWFGEKPKILDVVTIDGKKGIRIVGNNRYENNKPGAMIYGLNLTRN